MRQGMTLGILGGGQLGLMLAHAARRLGVETVALDSTADCPASSAADIVQGAFTDADAAIRVAQRSSGLVTLETEHIPARVLDQVAKVATVLPAPSVLATIQDRGNQKRFLDAQKLPHARYALVDSIESLRAAYATMDGPAVLKTRHGGYDGKGQARIKSPDGVDAAWEAIGRAPSILEAFVPFRLEVSALVARSTTGEIRAHGVAENEHRAGILHKTVAPARIGPDVSARAVRLATTIAETLDHVGMLAVEMFLMPDDTLLVNEIAPRVHNSGHYTLDACATSQFEQHVRAIMGMPLGATDQPRPAVMLNLLGDLWARGEPDWTQVLREPEARLYLYGKRKASPGRKMGHVTIVHEKVDEAHRIADRIHEALQGGG